MSTQPESKIQKAILGYLKMRGVFAWTQKNQGTFDPYKKIFRKTNQLKGVSDIVGILSGGTLLAIEVKTATGRVSPEQKAFLAAINNMGGIAFVARSVNDVKESLDKLEAPIVDIE